MFDLMLIHTAYQFEIKFYNCDFCPANRFNRDDRSIQRSGMCQLNCLQRQNLISERRVGLLEFFQNAQELAIM